LYCQTCHVCQIFKPLNRLPSGLLQSIQSSEPNEVHFIDLVGPLVPSQGYTFVLTLYDHFSKMVFFRALRNATSKVIINKLTEIFALTGVPLTLGLDNAKYFTSNLFKGVAKSMNINLKFISPYHSQSNPAERPNRSLRQLMATMIGTEDHSKWAAILPSIELAMRTAVNESTG